MAVPDIGRIGYRAPSKEGTLTPNEKPGRTGGQQTKDFNNLSYLAGAASHIYVDLLQERLCMAATLDRGQAHSYWPGIQR